jgi:hypothetical protein
MGNEITRRDMMKGLGFAGMLIGMEGLYASAQAMFSIPVTGRTCQPKAVNPKKISWKP